MEDAKAILVLNKEFNGEKAATLISVKDSLTHNKSEIVMIAYIDNDPVGFICGEISQSVCYQSKHGSIGELFVAENYRRRGIAGMLMAAIEKLFKNNGMKIITLGTSINNINAQKFYENCGYLRKEKIQYRKYIQY